MIISRKKIIGIIIFLVIINLITINSINDYMSFIEVNKNISHEFLVNSFIISGQKLTYNFTIYLSILLITFPFNYKNVFILTRFKNLDRLHNKIIVKNVILTIMVSISVIVLQILICIIYKVDFEILVMLKSIVSITLCSYSAFSLYNLLYQLNINNYLSVAIFIFLRFVLLISTLEINFIKNTNNLDLIINLVIFIELIITNYLSIFIYNRKKDLIL